MSGVPLVFPERLPAVGIFSDTRANVLRSSPSSGVFMFCVVVAANVFF